MNKQKRVAIVQPLYIPWKGHFDLINMADEFILLEDVQYRKRYWFNRNQIKSPQGLVWLTIPVKVKGRFSQIIRETEISDLKWNQKHWETIRRNYNKAPYFNDYADLFQDLYLGCEERFLHRINQRFLKAICQLLEIKANIRSSIEEDLCPGKTERLVDLCQRAGADVYLSGPTAKSYLDTKLFVQAGIELQFISYSDYPEYPQLYPPFIHEVSILDLLFNTGSEARKYMKSTQF